MKKELHELIDLRINMALAGRDPAKAACIGCHVQAPGNPQAKHYAGSNYPGAPVGGSRTPGLVQAQLRAEVDQQQNQVPSSSPSSGPPESGRSQAEAPDDQPKARTQKK